MTHFERNLIDVDPLRLLTRLRKETWYAESGEGFDRLISARMRVMSRIDRLDLQDMLYESIRQEGDFGGPRGPHFDTLSVGCFWLWASRLAGSPNARSRSGHGSWIRKNGLTM